MPPIGCLVAGAQHHAKLIGLPDEDAAGDRAALDRGAEGDCAVAVDRRRPERGKGAARGRRVTLGDDLAQSAARCDQHRLQRLASAPQRGEKDDVAARVDGRRIERGEHASVAGCLCAGECDGAQTCRCAQRTGLRRRGHRSIAAANTTVPSSLSAGTGCLPKPDSVPTEATRSPSRATATTRPRDHLNRPSPLSPRPMVAKKATSPRAFTGATMGVASAPKRSNTPPPGAASPVAATRCNRTVSSAATDANAAPTSNAPITVARPKRKWRGGMATSIGIAVEGSERCAPLRHRPRSRCATLKRRDGRGAE